MNPITKVSQITYTDLANYIRLYEITTDDQNMLTNALGVAKAYIENYTGLTESQLDDYQDLVQVVFVLVQDMYDTRSLYVEKSNLNNMVETILGMHSINLLPTALEE